MHAGKPAGRLAAGLAAAGLALLLAACSADSGQPLIIWSSRPEFASYVELFNATHTEEKAAVVYKENPARALPPQPSDVSPDIVVGAWLKCAATRASFSPLNRLLGASRLSRQNFYAPLLEYGAAGGKQLLLPVSFNLGAMVCNERDGLALADGHLLTLDGLRQAAEDFTRRDEHGTFLTMGFAPSWDEAFLYEASLLCGTAYREDGASFSYDAEALGATVAFMRGWTEAVNKDTTEEQNFQFKYLYMPKSRQMFTDRSLFTYMDSAELFLAAADQAEHTDFRWLADPQGRLPVEDGIITMGLYRRARHRRAAEAFIEWFFQPETQRLLLERGEAMVLDTRTFGIAGGFSSLQPVNEGQFPSYYRALLGNLPPAEALLPPNSLPYQWRGIRERIIIPYLQDCTDTNNMGQVPSLEERLEERNRVVY